MFNITKQWILEYFTRYYWPKFFALKDVYLFFKNKIATVYYFIRSLIKKYYIYFFIDKIFYWDIQIFLLKCIINFLNYFFFEKRIFLLKQILNYFLNYFNNKNDFIRFYFAIKGGIKLFFIKFTWNIFLLFSISIYLYLYIYINTISFKYLYKQIFILMIIWLLISTFIFLNKSYKYSKYTSDVQKFWKRSLVLFWLIELFLFLLAIYLYSICFFESKYFLDWKKITRMSFNNITFIKLYFFIITILLFLNLMLVFFHKYNQYTLIYLGLFIQFLLITYLFVIEVLKLEYIANHLLDTKNWTLNITKNRFQMNKQFWFTELKIRNERNFMAYLVFLKFWHILFIYCYYVFVLYLTYSNTKIPVDLISSNTQNLLILLLFYFFSLWILIKDFLMFYFNIAFFWYFLQYNYTNLIVYLILEIFNF